MSTILDQIRSKESAANDKLQRSQEKDRAEFMAIAVRDAAGDSMKGDPDRVVKLLQSLESTSDDYARLVGSLTTAARLLGEQVAIQEAGELANDQSEVAEQRAAVLESLSRKLYPMANLKSHLDHKKRQNETKIKQLKRDSPELFNADGELVHAMPGAVDSATTDQWQKFERLIKSAAGLMQEVDFFDTAESIANELKTEQ